MTLPPEHGGIGCDALTSVLLLEDDAALTEFAGEHPAADLQALRTLIRNARREQKEGRPPRAFREIYRVLREASSSPTAESTSPTSTR